MGSKGESRCWGERGDQAHMKARETEKKLGRLRRLGKQGVMEDPGENGETGET